MEQIINLVLLTHVLAGTVALATGLYTLIAKKGNQRHKKLGMVFFISMIVVSISAILVSLIKGGSFLLYLGIFSFYMNYTGFRSIRNKRLIMSKLDWAITLIALVNTIFMLLSFQLILMVFGIISLSLILGQLSTYYKLKKDKPIPKLAWLAQHIGMMVGTYISTLTAFLVVNISEFGGGWLVWMLPSAVLAPMIVYWTRKYTQNLKN